MPTEFRQVGDAQIYDALHRAITCAVWQLGEQFGFEVPAGDVPAWYLVVAYLKAVTGQVRKVSVQYKMCFDTIPVIDIQLADVERCWIDRLVEALRRQGAYVWGSSSEINLLAGPGLVESYLAEVARLEAEAFDPGSPSGDISSGGRVRGFDQ